MKLSRTVSYAVQAMLQLAQSEPEVPIPCSRLAASGNMPERFLLHILRNLVVHGILQSSRGVDGGYWLCRDPSEISLLDVIEAVEGPMKPDKPAAEGLNRETRAKLAQALSDVSALARRELAAIKLSQLAPQPPK